MKEGAVQAARTITAFAVAILSCIVLWYSNVHKCASFFFAWQGLFPMQVEQLPGLLCLCSTESLLPCSAKTGCFSSS